MPCSGGSKVIRGQIYYPPYRNERAAKMKQLSEFAAELEEDLRVKSNQIERLKRQVVEDGHKSGNGASPSENLEVHGDSSVLPMEIIQCLKDELHSMELKRLAAGWE